MPKKKRVKRKKTKQKNKTNKQHSKTLKNQKIPKQKKSDVKSIHWGEIFT